jgi:2-octaprenylphenol hydroxylase
MTEQNDPAINIDIAIVGAGMVGTALAASLSDTGFSIALIDGQTQEQLKFSRTETLNINDFAARVSALTVASRQLLEVTGAWQHLTPEQVMPYQKMHVWDHLGTARIDFDAAELYQDALGFIVENQHLVSALHQGIESQQNITRFLGVKLDRISQADETSDEHFLFLDDGQQIHCKLLVAADGANSKIREWAGISTREWDYQHHAIVATVKTEKKHLRACWQRFSESGPIAFLPLQDPDASEQFCSIVWSQTPERAEMLMGLSDRDFMQTLTAEIEASLGSIVEVSARYSIPLRQRHAKSYVKPGIALMGDAAHVIHPLAGQGVNLGFKDVQAFSDILHLADKEDLSINHQVLLNRYQRERQGDNLLMMSAMEGFKRLFEQSDPVIRWVRNTGLNIVNNQPFIKNQLAKHAMGLPVV